MKARLFTVALLCTLLLITLASCEQLDPPPHQHEYITMAPSEPSCTTPGRTEGRKCLSCGYIFERPTSIPALGHIYPDEWTVDRAPTEHREGEKSLRCTVCGDRSAVSPIARLAPSTQGLSYELNEAQNAYICVGIGTAKLENELRIPEEYNGLPVTEIADHAFENNRRLTSLYVPSSVTAIGRSAFAGCSSLFSIDLPDTLEYIAANAFSGTDCYFNRAMWEDGSFYIGRHLIAVEPSAAVGTYAIRSGTRTIGGAAFYECTKLVNIRIPEGVVSIGNSCFFGCSALTDISFPSSLRIIGNGALSYCTSMTEFCLPASVERILSNPFPGSLSLTSLTVDENNPWFYSVDNCLIERSTGTLVSGCTTSIIPDDGSIKRIGDGAFYECPFTVVELPEGVEEIGIAAFYQCPDLAQIILPSTLTSIEKQAFQGCKKLQQLVLPQSFKLMGESAFYDCDALIELIIPEGVEIISAEAFANCARLQSLSLPSSITTICKDALKNCIVLSSVYYAGTQEAWDQIVKEPGWNSSTWQMNIEFVQ